IGEYPPEYNPRVHGPYYPSRYYGKADTKFTQVKLGEMGQWLGRRNYDPLSMLRCIGRGWTRWQMKWMMPKRASIAPVVQFCMGVSLFFYVNNYRR
ncbi:hypothetical protein HELRODRAFT_126823, partial [Helobdella robusta]|uniref:Uncharacterized protein n=1 Tax=Helobdella robusta TaxID=6412 RepID=T1EHB2_HELRO